MTESWSIGPTFHFGPHALLPASDLQILCNILQCKDCWFRRLYHQLVAKDLQSTQSVKSRSNKVFASSSPFHSLTRAIQAVLRGFNLNRNCLTEIECETTNLTSLLHLHIKSDHHHITLVSTKLCVRKRYWVCPSHGRQLFDLLYCSDDDLSIPEKDGLGLHCTIRSIIPQGHSDFFRSVEKSSSSDESDCPEPTFSVKISYTPELYLLQSSTNSHKKLPADTNSACFTLPAKLGNKRLSEVNKKWLFTYSVNNAAKKVISSKSGSSDSCCVDKTLNSSRRVRFPSGNPVSAVYNLRTYATASRLERSNRIWEIEARSRYFDRLKYLISEGYEPNVASQLAADDDGAAESKSEFTNDSVEKLKDLQFTGGEPSKQAKTRRRKRHRKNKRDHKSQCPPHVHNPTDSSFLVNGINGNYQKFV
ncbi:unnamed protein product [Trichobilharzia regenti]|nr:unnamed protein product [Trichobilharzia regenti]